MNEDGNIGDQKSLRIPIQCYITSMHEEIFNEILEKDGLDQKSIIDSLNIELNQ